MYGKCNVYYTVMFYVKCEFTTALNVILYYEREKSLFVQHFYHTCKNDLNRMCVQQVCTPYNQFPRASPPKVSHAMCLVTSLKVKS